MESANSALKVVFICTRMDREAKGVGGGGGGNAFDDDDVKDGAQWRLSCVFTGSRIQRKDLSRPIPE